MGKFYRIPEEYRWKIQHLTGRLDTIMKNVYRGNDYPKDEVDDTLKQINVIHSKAKQFNSKDDVIGTKYENMKTEDFKAELQQVALYVSDKYSKVDVNHDVVHQALVELGVKATVDNVHKVMQMLGIDQTMESVDDLIDAIVAGRDVDSVLESVPVPLMKKGTTSDSETDIETEVKLILDAASFPYATVKRHHDEEDNEMEIVITVAGSEGDDEEEYEAMLDEIFPDGTYKGMEVEVTVTFHNTDVNDDMAGVQPDLEGQAD